MEKEVIREMHNDYSQILHVTYDDKLVDPLYYITYFLIM